MNVPCLTEFNISNNGNGNNISNGKALFETSKIWKTDGEITISFGNYPCSECNDSVIWSLIGNEAADNPYPSMVLGYVDPPFVDFELNGVVYLKKDFIMDNRNRCSSNSESIEQCPVGWKPGFSILHEFGHALGMKHEHQNNINNSNELVFDVPFVLEYFKKNFGWDESKIYSNVLEKYNNVNNVNIGSQRDSESIMNYPIPQDWLISGSQQEIYKYSETDKEWFNKIYPIVNEYKPTITVYFIDPSGAYWKKAWVEKIVMDELAPYVGVNFDFSKTLKPLAPGETYPPPTMEPLSTMSTLNIMIIIFVLFVVIILFVLFIKWWLKRLDQK